jgi:hypothetical protein
VKKGRKCKERKRKEKELCMGRKQYGREVKEGRKEQNDFTVKGNDTIGLGNTTLFLSLFVCEYQFKLHTVCTV